MREYAECWRDSSLVLKIMKNRRKKIKKEKKKIEQNNLISVP
jgi:hypothetical protein